MEAVNLNTLLNLVIMASMLGTAWMIGRSKYRDQLIEDLTAANTQLMTDKAKLERENEVLRDGFKADVIEGVAKALKEAKL